MTLLSVKVENAPFQKCCVPIHVFENCGININDIVVIKYDSTAYICRIEILPHNLEFTIPEMCIKVDNTVSVTFLENEFPVSLRQVQYSNIFSIGKPFKFPRIQVQLVLVDNAFDYKVMNPFFRKGVSILLSRYVICKNSVIKCSGHAIADLLGIHSIIVTDTFDCQNIWGQLEKSGSIDVMVFSSWNVNIDSLRLGGVKVESELLHCFITKKNVSGVLITGPRGCGKSSLVKKYCLDHGHFLFSLDCMTEPDLTANKCTSLIDKLTLSFRMSTAKLSILFINHLDKLESDQGEKKSLKKKSILLHLLWRLKDAGISVVGSVAQKQNVDPIILKYFQEEIVFAVPTFSQRKEMLQILSEPYFMSDIDFDQIACKMPGFVASDILNLIQEANRIFRERKKDEQGNGCQKGLEMKDLEKALLSTSPAAFKSSKWKVNVEPIPWSDIRGMEHIKKRLHLSLERPLRRPDVFRAAGLRCPSGLLLFGPPGCCKTTLARGLATQCSANFFAANPSQIYSQYLGDSEKNITQLFREARRCAPSIVFLDELDSLVCRRELDTRGQGVSEKVLSALLSEMDGLGVKVDFTKKFDFEKSATERESEDCAAQVVVVGATNRPDRIDDALLRPGRFDALLYVAPPDVEQRAAILRGLVPSSAVNAEAVAERTELFTGADLKHLCNTAVRNAMRRGPDVEHVTSSDFDLALGSCRPSVTREQIRAYELLEAKYGPVL